jgi:hypothetical protein
MSDETFPAHVPPAVAETEPERAAAQALTTAAQEPAAELAGKLTQLPAGVKLATNLDTYEKEKPSQPFWFQHGGAFFRLLDPDDVDFDDIIIVQENPRLMMHILLDPQQKGAYFEVAQGTRDAEGNVITEGVRMTVGKMKQLVKDYTKHFGLTDLGELAGSARR